MVIANKNQNNAKGVLPINPAAAMQQQHQQPQNPAPSNKSAIRLKLEVRRLPPALTKDEFLDAFGEEWKPMAGRVDWFQYRPGKSRGSADMSDQSRAYVHLTNQAHIKPFETKFLSITFHDAKGSYKDASLKHLQPLLEFAPNQRIPTAKQRQDGRQGTIDQDPEFIAFLERETQPVTKPASLEAVAVEKVQDKVSSTPLLDDLREKKATKAKAASSKPAKKDDKTAEKPATRGDADVSAKSGKSATKSAQANKDAVRVANKQAAKPTNTANSQATKSNQQTAASPAATPVPSSAAASASASATVPDTNTTPSAAPAPSPKPAAAAAVAADSSSSSKSKPAPKPAKQPRTRKGNVADKPNAQSATQDTTKSVLQAPPAILKKTPTAEANTKQPRSKQPSQTTPAQTSPPASPAPSPASSKSTKAAPQPAPGAVKAYLKHANASQGITEPLIIAALAAFGDIVKVDIDKRKGTALAEFKTHDGLKAAMTKRSISVAQGAVEVLEFRERPAAAGNRNPPAAARGGGSMRGKGRAGRGGGANAAVPAQSTTPAVQSPSTISASATADAT